MVFFTDWARFAERATKRMRHSPELGLGIAYFGLGPLTTFIGINGLLTG